MNTTTYLESESVRQQRTPRLLALGLAALGAGSALLALWAFYLRPWLGGASRIDAWLEQHRCALSFLCVPGFNLGSQPGVLASLLAVLFFALALRGQRTLWRDETPAPLRWLRDGSQRRWHAGAILAACLGALAGVLFQAVQALSGVTPSLAIWLGSIALLVLAALLWDGKRPAELLVTLADLIVAASMVAVVLGIGCLLAGLWVRSILLLVGGLALLAASGWWSARLGSQVSPREHAAMLALAVAALVLAMSRSWSWRFAFIGDEWNFYEVARNYLHNRPAFEFLGLRSSADYHTISSSILQSWVMGIAGETVFGWRLSSVLPFALSVPPVYVFTRWLAGPVAAVLAAGLLASSHLLLTFSMAAYNNTQALLPLTLGLGFLAFAAQSQRASLLRYLLVGLALGLAWFVFGLARLAVLPLGIMLLAYAQPLRRLGFVVRRESIDVPGLALAVVGALVVAAPMFFNLTHWAALLMATPVESEVATGLQAVGVQMARNAAHGLLAFLAGTSQTHHIAGPHLDPLTAGLLLAGLGFMLAAAFTVRRARAWLLAAGVFLIAVSVIQQYGFVSNTRMFILAPLYAVGAGLGGSALVHLILPGSAAARSAAVTGLVVVAAALNLNHIEKISYAHSYWPVQALLVQQVQATQALDRGGMPVFVVMPWPSAPMENTILRAHDAGRERLVMLSAQEALNVDQVCRAGSQRAMLLVDPRVQEIQQIRDHLTQCWPGFVETALLNQAGEVGLYRFLSQEGQHELLRPPFERTSARQHPDTLPVPDPGDVAVAADGRVFILSRADGRVYRFSADGKPAGSFATSQQWPSALALTPDGLLVVASAGDGSRLGWYRTDGSLVRLASVELDVGVPRGLAVRPDGEIIVADTGNSRVVRVAADGSILDHLTGDGRVDRPSTVLDAGDGAIWVLNAGGELLLLTRDDQVARVLEAPVASPEDGWRMVRTPQGDLIMAEPTAQRVVRRSALTGDVLHVWGGFERPVGLAGDSAGRLYVADRDLDAIGILPPVADGIVR